MFFKFEKNIYYFTKKLNFLCRYVVGRVRERTEGGTLGEALLVKQGRLRRPQEKNRYFPNGHFPKGEELNEG